MKNNKNKGTKIAVALTMGLLGTAGASTFGGSDASAHGKGRGPDGFQKGGNHAAFEKGNYKHHNNGNHFKHKDKSYFYDSYQALLGYLKLDEATFNQKIKEGKSLEQIAAEQNIAKADLTTFLVNQASDKIDGKVAKGKISAENAKLMKDNLPAFVEKLVTQTLQDYQQDQPKPYPFDRY